MSRRVTLKNHPAEMRLMQSRVSVSIAILFLLTGILLSRLIFMQIWQHAHYQTLAKNNQLSLLPLAPARGVIYDRNGVVLATNKPVFSLEIRPYKVKNLQATLAELTQVMTLSDKELQRFKRLRRQSRRFDAVPLKMRLNAEEIAKFAVNQYRFPGVFIKANLIRDYPMGAYLSHVLGYVGRINQKDLASLDSTNYSATRYVGKVGLEKYYEDKLHGTVGLQQAMTDASGRVIRELEHLPPKPGDDLYLTIDSRLQKVAMDAFGQERGALVAIDPNSGEVLALVSNPGYDPNPFVTGISYKAFTELQQAKDQPLYNRAIRGQYPMASTLKPILALQGLEMGLINPATTIHDPGWFRIPHNKHRYKDYMAHGTVNLHKAIQWSCDTYFYNLAYHMGITPIDNIMQRFGFGQRTGIDMGEELSGLVASPDWKKRTLSGHWYTGDTMVAGIGQGYMLTTPLQLAAATATLAMRGQRFQPHLLKQFKHADNPMQVIHPTPQTDVELKHPWHWDFVLDAMRSVVTRGTGRRFGRGLTYSAAAKTGTAQVFNAQKARYKKESDIPKRLRNHSLFIAFAPFNHPKLAVAVIVEHSSHRAPVVMRKVMDYYLKHSTITPTTLTSPTPGTAPQSALAETKPTLKPDRETSHASH